MHRWNDGEVRFFDSERVCLRAVVKYKLASFKSIVQFDVLKFAELLVWMLCLCLIKPLSIEKSFELVLQLRFEDRAVVDEERMHDDQVD